MQCPWCKNITWGIFTTIITICNGSPKALAPMVGIKITKTNNERIGVNLNLKHKTKEPIQEHKLKPKTQSA